MGYYFYPATPGNQYGPCEDPCHHKDCYKMREDACQMCVCGKPIGYDNRIVFLPGNRIIHARCFEEWAEAGKEDAALEAEWDRLNTCGPVQQEWVVIEPAPEQSAKLKRKPFMISVDPARLETIKAFAADNGQSVSAVYDTAITEYLRSHGVLVDDTTPQRGGYHPPYELNDAEAALLNQVRLLNGFDTHHDQTGLNKGTVRTMRNLRYVTTHVGFLCLTDAGLAALARYEARHQHK